MYTRVWRAKRQLAVLSKIKEQETRNLRTANKSLRSTYTCVPIGGLSFISQGIEHWLPFPDNEETKKAGAMQSPVNDCSRFPRLRPISPFHSFFLYISCDGADQGKKRRIRKSGNSVWTPTMFWTHSKFLLFINLLWYVSPECGRTRCFSFLTLCGLAPIHSWVTLRRLRPQKCLEKIKKCH